MAIEVELPDGSVAEFPDGTDNATIERALRTQSMSAGDGNWSRGPSVRGGRRRPVRKAEYGGFAGTSKRVSDIVTGPKQRRATYNFTGAPSVATQLGGQLDGLQHHALNLPIGIAQLAGNTLDKGIQAVAGGTEFARNSARVNAQKNEEVRAREAAYQARTDGNAGSYVGATGGEILPWMAGMGALRTAGYLPKATTTAQKVGLLAGEGAVMGAAQPVLGEDGYWGEKGLQTSIGAATGPALMGVAKAGKSLLNAADHILRPDRVAQANIARLYGSDPATLAKLRNAPEYVPGERPTAAQVLQTPEAVQAERVLRNNPGSASAFAQADNANNQARMDVVRQIAGDDSALRAAVDERRAATQPFRLANLPEEGSRLVDSARVSEQLKKLTFSPNATVRAAAQEHLGILKVNATKDGKVPAHFLDDLRQEVGGMLAKHAPNGVVGTKEQAKYAPVLTQITDTLDGAVPGYRDYLSAYAKKSESINTMESVQKLLDPNAPGSLNAAGDPQLAAGRLKMVLRGDDKARYPMSDDARTQLEGVRESLARRSISDNKLASSGPGTAADLQSGGMLSGAIFGSNLGRQGGWLGRTLGTAAGGLAGAPFGPAGAMVGAGIGSALSDGVGAVNGRIAARAGTAAADSGLTADAIEAYLRRQKPTRARAVLNQYLLPYETP